jgi:hypothetical protein
LKEKRLRLEATERFVAFTEFTYPRYRPARLHYRIAEQLIERDEVDRLMLLVPPRHGKSETFPKMEAAQSEIERKRVWDWYTGTIYNRLMPGGAIVVIKHRMHEQDLSGRLLAMQAAGGDKWEDGSPS